MHFKLKQHNSGHIELENSLGITSFIFVEFVFLSEVDSVWCFRRLMVSHPTRHALYSDGRTGWEGQGQGQTRTAQLFLGVIAGS